MTNTRVAYPVTTTFGRRIAENRADKVRVAEKIVELFIGNGSSAFIGDGSSTFYVGLEVFAQRRQAVIWTNHLGIAHEYALWNSQQDALPETRVVMAEGDVSANLMMTGGTEAVRFASMQAARALNIVLSVKHLFSEQGPAGSDQPSLEIKQVAAASAMPSGRKIIYVADFSKLTSAYTVSSPLVYPAARDWDDTLRQPNIFIVSTRHPDATGYDILPQNPKSELDWYRFHSYKLRRMMGDRYIEV